MVVDDEEDIVDTLRDVFEDEGYDVATAPNGAAALSWLKSAPTKPNVVVLDLLMPVMDGNALYAAMQRDPDLAKVSVVISTSDSVARAARRPDAQEAGQPRRAAEHGPEVLLS